MLVFDGLFSCAGTNSYLFYKMVIWLSVFNVFIIWLSVLGYIRFQCFMLLDILLGLNTLVICVVINTVSTFDILKTCKHHCFNILCFNYFYWAKYRVNKMFCYIFGAKD